MEELKLIFRCNITPTTTAKNYLSDTLDVRNLTSDENMVRDDQANLLVFACATFQNIPEKNIRKMQYEKVSFLWTGSYSPCQMVDYS